MSELENPMQKLWQDQPVEGINMSIQEIHQRAGKFERTIRWRNIREYVGSLVAMGMLGYFFATAHGVVFRTTFGLFIAGLLVVVVQLYRKGRAHSMPAGTDTMTSLRFYRMELERQLNVVSNVWAWYLGPLVPGFVVYTIGLAVTIRRPEAWIALAVLDAVVAGMFYVIWRMNMRAARCLRRMIAELNGVE